MKFQQISLSLFFYIFLIIISGGCTKEGTGLPSINAANDKSVGASAHDLLSGGTYTSAKVEIQYMPGFEPNAISINNLVDFLNTLINKPDGISVVLTQIPSAGKTILSLNDIATIEKNNRTVFTSGNQLGVYFLFTDGNYTENNVLGLAYRNTSICLLGKTIHDNSGGFGQASRIKVETTVLEHEAGHILGLVDLGSAMQTNHKDAAHGSHCNNSDCLMYYASESTDILGFLIIGNPPALDANCKADLIANGGK